MRSRVYALGCFFLGALCALGCSRSQTESSVPEENTSVENAPLQVGGMEASWSVSQKCLVCHFAGTQVETPWEYVRVYPEWVWTSPVKDSEPAGQRGWTALNPTQSTAVEWLVWQKLVPEGSKDRGKDCVSCHIRDTPQALSDVQGIASTARHSAQWKEFHRWMGVRDVQLHDTFGLWLSVDTSRSVLAATVKVMNYGAGHRAPSGLGEQVILEVRARGGAQWRDLKLLKGERIGEEGGEKRLNTPGLVYGRTYEGPSRARSAVAQGATRVFSDTRLQGGEHDELSFIFVLPETRRPSGEGWEVDVRLVFREVGVHGERSSRVIEREVIQY